MFLSHRTSLKGKLNNSLYLNSIFLILTTGAMAGFGFIFWLINAKLFSNSDVGIATAIIPTVTMVATGSLLGLDNSIVRFINLKEKRGEFIRSALFITTLLTVIGSALFALLSFYLSPTISAFFASWTNFVIFFFLSITTTINLLCDAIYLAHKKTSLTLYITTFHSALKSIFPFLFISFGAAGILLAAAIAQSVGVLINFYILNRKWQFFNSFSVSLGSLKGIWKYSAHNYVSSLLSLIPYSVIPIIIINHLGAHESAYYYIVIMIANLMYTVASATTKSLFAEGSHDSENLHYKIIKSVYFIFILLVPGIIILFMTAGIILNFFGSEFADNGTMLLKILGLSTIPLGLYSISNAIFRIKHKSHYLILCTALLAVLEISLTYYFISYGLVGVGYATLFGSTIIAIFALFLVYTIRD